MTNDQIEAEVDAIGAELARLARSIDQRLAETERDRIRLRYLSDRLIALTRGILPTPS